MMSKDKLFPLALGASAIFVAVIAAFFSVRGIGMLFSGAAISSMLMATALEFGKLTATTFIYRYWDKTTKLMRLYLISAIFTLMAITSLGVFGWLSSAYQSSSLQYEITQQQVSVLENQKLQFDTRIQQSTDRLASLSELRSAQEDRLSEVLKNPTLSRNPTQFRQAQEQNIQLIRDTEKNITSEQTTIGELQAKQADIDNKISAIKLDGIKSKDIVTFKFVADSLGLDLNRTVKWFIVAIIIVFDPLAVCLILAYNVAVYEHKKKPVAVVPPVVVETVAEPDDIKKN